MPCDVRGEDSVFSTRYSVSESDPHGLDIQNNYILLFTLPYVPQSLQFPAALDLLYA
jgi:hypothetical protein